MKVNHFSTVTYIFEQALTRLTVVTTIIHVHVILLKIRLKLKLNYSISMHHYY